MAKINVQDQIASNRRNSVFLMFIVFLSFVFISYAIGLIYDPGLAYFFVIFASILSILFIIFSYYNSDKLVLSLTNARPATKKEHQYLVNVVEELAIAAGIPAPKIYVIDSDEINAFATGRNPEHGVICVSRGLMKMLNRSELEGVIAHEMSHIQNYDVRFATLVAVLVGIVVIMSDMFRRSLWFGGRSNREERKSKGSVLVIVGVLFAIIAPIFVKLIQLAISRKREYLADANGAFLTRYPEGLASALEKIKNYNRGMRVSKAVSHMFFVNPLTTKKMSSLVSTHPPIDERIKTLRSM